ncbi:hypothetical protein [Streptomyces sp. NBC_01803]|uniref:hypothetical protein n=1 Tax=Streptomyces sp. NBC_01803 TaxID=2975946 RepID=UPI002DD9D0EC|nr:hypothetical protein [Streptomyces sp. NBC_01803]WSA44321.1 hypothetical protein OIE51_08945 [Streptomyces sp. NBC_01803]
MLRTRSRSLLTVAGGVAALGLTLTAVTSASASPGGTGTGSGADAAVPGAHARAHAHANNRYTGEEIHHFLEGFYGNSGPRAWERENLVSDTLKERVAETEGYDVLLCSQNIPLDIEVGEVTTAQSAGVGWAPIFLSWGDDQELAVFTAYVDLDARQPIELLDVDCAPPEVG